MTLRFSSVGCSPHRQRPLNVRPEVFDVLDADGEADEAIGDAGGFADVFRDGGVCHGGRMADEAFDAAEALGLGKEMQSADEGERAVLRVAEVGEQHAAAAGHLLLRERILWVAREEGIAHGLHALVFFESGGERERVGVVPLHAEGLGLRAA